MILRTHDSYRHEALLYRDADEFLAGTVDFVVDGLALGQSVMVAVPPPRLGDLRAALGTGAAREVFFVDMAELGRNPARIIPAWRHFLDRFGSQGGAVRGIGEPVWPGRRPHEVAECQLHEALLNVAVAPDAPFWLRCPYDVTGLGDDLALAAGHSHPAVVRQGDLHGSTSYGGLAYLESLFAAALVEPERPVDYMSFQEGDLAQVRRSVTLHAVDAGLDSERTCDLVLAMTELATNSLRHGGGHGSLRTWREADALVYEVRDDGHIQDPLVGRHAPGPSDEGGRGVWMANQLCDLVQVRSSAEGTVVRTYTWL